MKVGDVNLHFADGPKIYADNDIWLLCDGALYSRKEFPLLYMAIGMTYADEDARCCNAELFPVPNLMEPVAAIGERWSRR